MPATRHAYGVLRQTRVAADGGTDRGAWFVSVRRQGRTLTRRFSDEVYGSEEAARIMAVAWRDAALLLVPPRTHQQGRTLVRKNNTSGIAGVYRDEKRGIWEAILRRGDKAYHKTFQDKIHGEPQAKALAVAAREELLRLHPLERFRTRDPHATEAATRQFGELLDQPFVADSPPPAIDPKIAIERIAALNEWFDRLRPRQVNVRLARYGGKRDNNYNFCIAVTDGSSPAQARAFSRALQTHSWQQRLPQGWAFLKQAVTEQHDAACWKEFEARYQADYFGCSPEQGFHARYRGNPPKYDAWRRRPDALGEWLGDFEVPATAAGATAAEAPAKAATQEKPKEKSNPPRSAATGSALMMSPAQQSITTRPIAAPSPGGSPMSRTFIAHSPLGDQLLFRSLIGREQISRLFEFRVRLLSESANIAAKSLLGQDMSIEIDLTTEMHGGGKRYLSGQITQFAYVGKDGSLSSYEAVLRPWLWHATRRSDFKIFQFKTVPEIVQEVLAPYGFVVINKLTGSYRTWDYCVQYNETDHNFISRLLEAEGGYYFFEHSQGSHHLILGDDIGSHSPLPQAPTTHPYYPGDRAAHVHDEDFIDSWNLVEDIASGRFATDDYDFQKPKALLDALQAQPAGHSLDDKEIYDWPGGYTDAGDGENYARVRIEQQKAQREIVQGQGNTRNLAPGYLFTLSKYPRADQNKQYLVEAAVYQFEENVRRSDGAGGGSGGSREADSPTRYRLSFDVVPATVSYRSQRTTPKPRTTGPQTAVVVGPPGEEIYTDKYGRVKVQFHWDRYGKNNENSSCWIRVSSPWAGAGYGGIHIPRIGQEVIVDFLNGDPDYPMITGRVYNAMQMPPWELPKHKTQSGYQTHWSKGGGGKHMLRFEDLRGIEHIELSTDHGNTHLHMGYLMNQGTEAKRSYGFELRTNEWGAIRADKGLLLTTYTSDFKQKISHDSPDGFEQMGSTLAQSSSLIAESDQAVKATKDLLQAVVQQKGAQTSGLAAGLPQTAGAVVGALLGAGSGSTESSVSGDMDPAMADAQNMLNLSRKVDSPIVSIVSPEGQTMISPKPVVISSGQSVSIRSQAAMTLTAGAQLTQLAKSGMVTQVSSGGQVNVVSGGDVISHAAAGAMNLMAQTDASLTSTTANANLVGEKSVLVNAKSNDAFVVGKERVALVCGDASIVLLADGTIILKGKKGFFEFSDELDQQGSKIFLNCK